MESACALHVFGDAGGQRWIGLTELGGSMKGIRKNFENVKGIALKIANWS